ncbi:aminoacyl-tRNA hydrolase [Aurantibacter crassamenti]|uniref:alternative ribosome rescue aminoacyl-tRNA hydrolase ArfB n=1 Tax=Aurantibacter crassamenti TaxID=1837375 RepID=UPI0019394A7B|nr:alternative ribosome rescue aminoacyl-tRNA hydrolase ArfB [Aurantibacter crassamenti]MBM1105077.1 aminoacyl-tRNA hydrolase [Aurantibacter crassamenti]
MNNARIVQELQFKAVRSSGAGGQHVNKVSTKVELTFDMTNSLALSEEEKERISKKLASKLTKEGLILLQEDRTRSQHKNKDVVIKRFLALLTDALKIPKRRKKSRPTKSSIEKRLKSKRISSLKKSNREKPKLE